MDDHEEPRASRPYMPGYGVLPGDQGSGLLTWAWAEQRLAASHDYWLATQWPGHPPHVMPVWGVWLDGALWFSCGLGSRKARNLEGDARCTLTTDDAVDPVVVQGAAVRIEDPEQIQAFARALNAKYGTSYDDSFFDPKVNGSYRVALTWAFALVQEDFVGSPTRWTFPVSEGPVAIGRPSRGEAASEPRGAPTDEPPPPPPPPPPSPLTTETETETGSASGASEPSGVSAPPPPPPPYSPGSAF